jgi:hypothetical protein
MQFEDRLAEEAFVEVAALLATAYQRYIAIRRVPPERPQNDLAKSASSSLHGQ